MRALAILSAVLLMAGPAPAQDSYQVQPGDRLSITVLEDQNLNTSALVRPDGRITLPIAGSIVVAGRSPEQITAIVRDRLAGGFNVPPTVNVALIGLAPPSLDDVPIEDPESVFIFSEVRSPGRLPLDVPLTVLQAIAQAGGLDRFAKGESIQIRRVDPATSQETIYSFNFEEVEAGRTLATNITLVNGDVIYIPERGLFD